MHQGRYEKHAPVGRKYVRRRKLNKYFLVTLSVVLLMGIAVGSTLAYIIAGDEAVTNSFTPGRASCSVGANYAVTNNGNVDVYIRAAVTINWENDAQEINGIAPVAGVDYKVTPGSGWALNREDGYYYYSGKVSENGVTSAVCTVEPLTDAPYGFELSVEVLAEAIQAEGVLDGDPAVKPITDAWGVAAPQN